MEDEGYPSLQRASSPQIREYSHSEEDTESNSEDIRLLAPTEQKYEDLEEKRNQDIIGNVFPSKKTVPILYILLFLALLCLNIIFLVFRIINKHQTVKLWGVSLWNWTLFIDVCVVGYLGFWAIIRLFLVCLEKLASKFVTFQYLYFFFYPFETVLHIGLWALLLFILFPYVFQGLLNIQDSVLHEVYTVLWSIVVVVVILAIKVIIMNILEAYIYRDLRVKIAKNLKREQWLMNMEKPFAEHNVESVLLSRSKFGYENVERFLSVGLTQLHHKQIAGYESVKTLAEHLANKLIEKFDEGKGYLTSDHFSLFLRQQDIAAAFQFFDMDGDGVVSPDDLKKSISSIFITRKDIMNQLKSRRMVLDVTNSLLVCFMGIVAIIAVLINFRVDIYAFLLPLGTIILALSFAYGSTLQELFNSLYMLYFVHPFNIGDKVSINGGPFMVVENVGVLTTYFLSADGYGVYVRNSLLTHSKISNWNKGDKVSLNLKFWIISSATMEQYEELNAKVSIVLQQLRVWKTSYQFYISDSDMYGNFCLTLSIQLKHSAKWQDTLKWRTEKTKVVFEVQRIINDMKIPVDWTYYNSPSNFLPNSANSFSNIGLTSETNTQSTLASFNH